MALAEGRKESRVQPKQKGEEGGGGGSGGGGGGGHFRRAGNACHWRGTAVTCSGERSSEEAATAAGGFLRAVTEIHVDNGKWTALSASLFSSLPALFSLHASYNAITVVENGALRASTKLSALILSNNELTAVPSPLQYLHNLRQLGLSGNSIAELPARLHFKKLSKLELSDNKIRDIPIGFLDEQQSLQEARFDGNELETIPPFLFRSMAQMHLIRFDRNKLTTLPRCMFRETFRFHDAPYGLMLNDNLLTSVPEGMLRLPNLAHLALADNKIERLDARDCIGEAAEGGNEGKAFVDLVMIDLDLSDNMLGAIAPTCLEGLPNVLRLTFAKNPLGCPQK
eukprot:gene11844-29913_t